EKFSGRVVHVADGDTIAVLVGREPVKVRLAEIDAPERGQPWSRRARQALVEKVAHHTVEVSWRFTDPYGRPVGPVRGAGPAVSRGLVRGGPAWVSRRWLRDGPLLDDESPARSVRAGLWSLPGADRVPPWEWRDRARARSARLLSASDRASGGPRART